MCLDGHRDLSDGGHQITAQGPLVTAVCRRALTSITEKAGRPACSPGPAVSPHPVSSPCCQLGRLLGAKPLCPPSLGRSPGSCWDQPPVEGSSSPGPPQALQVPLGHGQLPRLGQDHPLKCQRLQSLCPHKRGNPLSLPHPHPPTGQMGVNFCGARAESIWCQ